MEKRLTVIGATGKLAVLIIHQLSKNNVKVTAIVRDVEKAQQTLPTDIELLAADLKDTDSLQSALQGTETLYLNLSVHDLNAEFQPEIDGVKNILTAAKGTPLKHILKISGIGALHPEFNLKGDVFGPNEIRIKSHGLIKDSGIDYTIFHPTWFLNALPWFLNNDEFTVYGKDIYPFYWTNTTDFAGFIMNTIHNKNVYNTELPVQGTEGYTFSQAGEKFIKLIKTTAKIKQIPIEKTDKFAALMEYYENFQEQLVAQKTWDLLGKTQTSFEVFVRTSLAPNT